MLSLSEGMPGSSITQNSYTDALTAMGKHPPNRALGGRRCSRLGHKPRQPNASERPISGLYAPHAANPAVL